MHADSVVQTRTFDIGSSTRRERHNSYSAVSTTVHLVMFKNSLSRDLKNPTTSSTAQIQLSTQWQKLNCLPHWSNLNFQLIIFQNPQILRTISSGHDVIHTPASIPVWGLLWQWRLSYPLRTSVNCSNWPYTWTHNPNSSKSNQTEW